jgi:quercetin dioxygenase-like cupin family protein
MTTETSTLPSDDLQRNLTLARPDEDQKLPHIGLAGDTYTILLTGEDTAGRYCLIDMFVPPGGGPLPHRHDFEEMFAILEGEIEVTFRGAKSVVRAGETANIPANAPHHFRNSSERPARLLLHVFASRAGRIFYGHWVPRREPDGSAPKARRAHPSGAQSKS